MILAINRVKRFTFFDIQINVILSIVLLTARGSQLILIGQNTLNLQSETDGNYEAATPAVHNGVSFFPLPVSSRELIVATTRHLMLTEPVEH